MPVSRIFLIFRVLVSAFSAFSFCEISSDPCLSGVGGTFRIFHIFPGMGFESLHDFKNLTDRLHYDWLWVTWIAVSATEPQTEKEKTALKAGCQLVPDRAGESP